MSAFLLLFALLAAGHIEPNEACEQKLDLLFIMDESTTICGDTVACQNWTSNLQFAKDIVNSLTIGPSDSKVAVLTFANNAEVDFTLNNYTEKNALLSAIDNVPFNGGEFDNLPSSTVVITGVFNILKGDRLGVRNVGIIITDGVPGITTLEAKLSATAIEADGVRLYVVCITTGVKPCTEEWAKAIATTPKLPGQKTYFLIPSYSVIDTVREALMEEICAYLGDII